MNSLLRNYALRGAEIGIVERMELALEYSSNNPDEVHPEWVGNMLNRCAQGDWAEAPHAQDFKDERGRFVRPTW